MLDRRIEAAGEIYDRKPCMAGIAISVPEVAAHSAQEQTRGTSPSAYILQISSKLALNRQGRALRSLRQRRSAGKAASGRHGRGARRAHIEAPNSMTGFRRVFVLVL